jgi:hypothetical protein
LEYALPKRSAFFTPIFSATKCPACLKGDDKSLIRLRVTGLPADIQEALELLNNTFVILSTTPYYRNRGSIYTRVYVNVELKSKTNNSSKG